MKKKRFYFKLPVMVMAAMSVCMSFVSCNKDEVVEQQEEKVDPKRDKIIDTWTFHYYKQQGTYLIGNVGRQPSTWAVWHKDGPTFNVFFVQDGIITRAGTIDSNETSLSDEERESINLTYNVDVPPSIRRTSQYDYNVLAFSSSIDFTLTNGNIICQTDLIRDNFVYLWDVGYTSKTGSDIASNMYSKSLFTSEKVFIYNKTNDTISVRHKGFEAKEKWYYSKATVTFTPLLQTITNGTSVGEGVISEAIKIAPGDYGRVTSKYVPTGKRMTDAKLVLEIDGKEVKTPAESSNVDIRYGEYYCMAVKWNGESLEWVYDVTEE